MMIKLFQLCSNDTEEIKNLYHNQILVTILVLKRLRRHSPVTQWFGSRNKALLKIQSWIHL